MSSIWTLIRFLGRPGKAAGTDLVGRYERMFAETILGDSDAPCLAFWRGRAALWSILCALQGDSSDEVVLPAFTCEMVPAAAKFAGRKCVYADAEPGQYNAAAGAIAEATTERTSAIVCQHTYGIASAVREIVAEVGKRSVALVEDCCQLVSPDSRWGPVGRVGDAAFFSTQWSKPFSTGLGGMATFTNAELHKATSEIRSGFSREGNRERARSLAVQVLLYELTVQPATRATIARVYRWAQRTGLVRGTTTAEEYGRTMPPSYPAAGLNVQADLGMRQLRQWPRNLHHRQRLTQFYLECLGDIGVDTSPLRVGCDEPTLWAIPLQVENKPELLRRAETRGLPIATWFDAIPAHVAPATAGQYDYRPGQCPRSERLFSREIHLSTAPSVTQAKSEAAVEFLREHAIFADWQLEETPCR